VVSFVGSGKVKFLLPFLFLALVCTGCGSAYRAGNLIGQTEENLEKAEKYNASRHIPGPMAKANGMIIKSHTSLQKGENKTALRLAQNAYKQSLDVLALALRAETAISLKKTRDALEIIRINNLDDENGKDYEGIRQTLKKAENAFLAEQLEQSLLLSRNALMSADILLEPHIKEALLAREKALKKKGMTDERQKELDALNKEAQQAFKRGEYQRAKAIWKKIERDNN